MGIMFLALLSLIPQLATGARTWKTWEGIIPDRYFLTSGIQIYTCSEEESFPSSRFIRQNGNTISSIQLIPTS